MSAGKARRLGSGAKESEDLAGFLRGGAAQLGLVLPDNAVGQLIAYLNLLVKWNAVYNLTAIRDPAAMMVHHLLDSLAIVPVLQQKGHLDRIVDVGSGGGLPGIVLAIVWPEAEIQLVEPVGKKAAFLRQCAVELQLARVKVHDCRIEEVPPEVSPPALVVCRAFASLPDFVAGIDHLAAPSTIVAAMKGAVPHAEVAGLTDGWQVAEILPLSVPFLEAQRHLLLLRRASQEDLSN